MITTEEFIPRTTLKNKWENPSKVLSSGHSRSTTIVAMGDVRNGRRARETEEELHIRLALWTPTHSLHLPNSVLTSSAHFAGLTLVCTRALEPCSASASLALTWKIFMCPSEPKLMSFPLWIFYWLSCQAPRAFYPYFITSHYIRVCCYFPHYIKRSWFSSGLLSSWCPEDTQQMFWGANFTNNSQTGLNLSSGKIPSCNLARFVNRIRLYFLCLETLKVGKRGFGEMPI